MVLVVEFPNDGGGWWNAFRCLSDDGDFDRVIPRDVDAST